MPFVTVSRAMAKRRADRSKTLQGFEIKSLGSRFESAQRAARNEFQSEQQGLVSQYQQQLETYGKQMGEFENRARAFQTQSDEYNAAVDRFNTLTALPGTFSALPVQGKSQTYLSIGNVKSAQDLAQFDVNSPTGRVLSSIGGIDTVTNPRDNVTRITGFDSANLPSNLVLKQVGTSAAGYPDFQLFQRGAEDPGEFTGSLGEAPSAPMAPETNNIGERYSASLRQEQEFFEREIGERRLASQRARRRIGDRPLLSGEAA
jgi:hypothetical protein